MQRVTGQRIRWALFALAAGQLALGLWMLISPGTFYRWLGAFGPRNDHYLRDVATFYLASGVVLIAAIRRPRWRRPVLLFATLQYAFHFVNHLVDIGDSDPSWVGPVDAVALGLTGATFAALFVWTKRDRS
jgi:uncharacterized protein DUF4345